MNINEDVEDEGNQSNFTIDKSMSDDKRIIAKSDSSKRTVIQQISHLLQTF